MAQQISEPQIHWAALFVSVTLLARSHWTATPSQVCVAASRVWVGHSVINVSLASLGSRLLAVSHVPATVLARSVPYAMPHQDSVSVGRTLKAPTVIRVWTASMIFQLDVWLVAAIQVVLSMPVVFAMPPLVSAAAKRMSKEGLAILVCLALQTC